jgi:hypothetical protein
VQAVFRRLGQDDAFDELVGEIRQRHRAKRNLMKRLDERGWAQSVVARPPDSPPPRRAVHS